MSHIPYLVLQGFLEGVCKHSRVGRTRRKTQTDQAPQRHPS